MASKVHPVDLTAAELTAPEKKKKKPKKSKKPKKHVGRSGTQLKKPKKRVGRSGTQPARRNNSSYPLERPRLRSRTLKHSKTHSIMDENGRSLLTSQRKRVRLMSHDISQWSPVFDSPVLQENEENTKVEGYQAIKTKQENVKRDEAEEKGSDQEDEDRVQWGGRDRLRRPHKGLVPEP